MNNNDTRNKLENIIKGIVIEGAEDNCTTIRNLLCTSFSTSTTVKRDFESKAIIKEEQAGFLKSYAQQNAIWITHPPDPSQFLARGGEATVYFDAPNKSVTKLNDGIYYATWLEFFNSVVIHNLLFPNTAYIFLGFIEVDGIFQAVMRQPFVTSDSAVDLADVKELLSFNGFENRLRRGVPTNNYYNKELGIILEDIHDENVIVNSETLFFIDTVFYTAFQHN
jgi:Serine/Threonine/Tyrosine Kinase found in polyvalent proteins